MQAAVKDGIIVGYTTAYSHSRQSLMETFNQSVIDAGTMGANCILILKHNFVIGTKSSTFGFGSSGVTGLLNGAHGATTFGSTMGFARSKAKPVTYPFMQVMCLYSKTLATITAFEIK